MLLISLAAFLAVQTAVALASSRLGTLAFGRAFGRCYADRAAVRTATLARFDSLFGTKPAPRIRKVTLAMRARKVAADVRWYGARALQAADGARYEVAFTLRGARFEAVTAVRAALRSGLVRLAAAL